MNHETKKNKPIDDYQNIFYKLVALEQQSYTGGNLELPNHLESTLIWNLFLKDRYGGSPVEFCAAEKNYLIEFVDLNDVMLPRFVSVINSVMGPDFFDKILSQANFEKSEFEFYLIILANDVLPFLTGEDVDKASLSRLINWMLEPCQFKSIYSANSLPKLAISKYLAATSLRKQFSLNTQEGYWRYLGWFCHWVLPTISFHYMAKQLLDFLDAPSKNILFTMQDVMTVRMEALHNYIDIELNRFDLNTREGRLGYLGWYCLQHTPQLENYSHPDWLTQLFDSPSVNIPDAKNNGITVLMEAIYYYLHTEVKHFDLNAREGRLGYLGWFCLWYAPKLKNYHHPKWLFDLIDSPSDSVPFAKQVGLSFFLEAIWYSDPALINWLNIRDIEECRRLVYWFINDQIHLIKNYKNPSWVLALFTEHKFQNNLMIIIDEPSVVNTVTSLVDTEQYIKEIFHMKKGVNLVGWPKTEIGIGEDVRVSALAMHEVNLPFNIIDAANRLPPQPTQKNLGYEKFIVDHFDYDTDIVLLDASTQFKYYAFDWLNRRSINRRIVGVFPWELPQWPSSLAFTLDHVDCFWAATQFIYEAFKPYFHKEKIFLAPPAVFVPENVLDDFSIDNIDMPFTFLTIFDGLSSIHRKNPFATVLAFKAAFPISCRDVRLIIKTMNLTTTNDELNHLINLIKVDDRIEIINDALSRDALYSLIKKSHCFVSLHRSEGFGRNIAEAMHFKRPVICSAYSGNLDFCFNNNSYLVEGKEVPVKPGEYAFSKNQYWFDASVEHASVLMKEVYVDRANAARVAMEGARYIRSFHSVKEAGNRYKQLLQY